MYAYSITYCIYENDQVYKKGIMGVKHSKKCTPTNFKKYIKSTLPMSKKQLRIGIGQVDNISEEECDQRFGNETFNPR